MSIYIQKDQKQHLEKLISFTNQEISALLERISNGDIFKEIVEGSEDDEFVKPLVKLLVDAKRLQLSDNEFESQLRLQTRFANEQIHIIKEFYKTSEKLLQDLVESNEQFFRDLEWRVETKIASRFCDSLQVDPKIVMKFHVDKESSHNHREHLTEKTNSNTRKEIIVKTDINNLTHIIAKLEAAKVNVGSKTPK